ncbi:hypothetical protein [Streptomyces sp. F001]|uniref:hypothetical protein n=1 Tax=Streptomyces sp. F001 TaxID=1510026 RepID=UPI001F103E76|nr:hypothetical protein [Streptomyces sp. F001]
MGDSVRRLYEQAPISTAPESTAVSPCTPTPTAGPSTSRSAGRWRWLAVHLRTTLDSEYLSDIVGERAILLGAVHGIVESLYARYRLAGDDEVTAYERSCENVTGPIARTISRAGLRRCARAWTP